MGNYILAMGKTFRISIAFALTALLLLAAGPGFRSRRQFDEHYAKHGREFGNISRYEYLERAQALRDAPARGPNPSSSYAGWHRVPLRPQNGLFWRIQSRPDHPNLLHPERR